MIKIGEFVPKYNMPKGLEQIKLFTTEQQVAYYETYLERLKDTSLQMVVLKKSLYRAGSLGVIPYETVMKVVEEIDAYERSLDSKEQFRKVDFQPMPYHKIGTVKKAVNLLGLQGDNCQTTFHHRFVNTVKDPLVILNIMMMALAVVSEKGILSSKLLEQIKQMSWEFEDDFESETK